MKVVFAKRRHVGRWILQGLICLGTVLSQTGCVFLGKDAIRSCGCTCTGECAGKQEVNMSAPEPGAAAGGGKNTASTDMSSPLPVGTTISPIVDVKRPTGLAIPSRDKTDSNVMPASSVEPVAPQRDNSKKPKQPEAKVSLSVNPNQAVDGDEDMESIVPAPPIEATRGKFSKVSAVLPIDGRKIGDPRNSAIDAAIKTLKHEVAENESGTKTGEIVPVAAVAQATASTTESKSAFDRVPAASVTNIESEESPAMSLDKEKELSTIAPKKLIEDETVHAIEKKSESAPITVPAKASSLSANRNMGRVDSDTSRVASKFTVPSKPRLELNPRSDAKDESEVKVPDPLDHADDYSWLQGRVSKVHTRGGYWEIRYAPLDQEDTHGGKMMLVGVNESAINDGDLVRVKGSVLGYDGKLRATKYHIAQMSLVERH